MDARATVGETNPTDVSVVTGAGLDVLRRRLVAALTEREDLRDPPAITNIRHLALVREAAALVARAHDALLGGTTEELVLADLGARAAIARASHGPADADDLLHHIFARFCVGK